MVKTVRNADYRTPVCGVLEIAVEGPICASAVDVYGDYGEAGQQSGYIDFDGDL